MVAARLQGRVEGCASGCFACLTERHHLGVALARRLGVTPADNLAVPDQHRAHRRVRADAALGAPGKLEGV